ncbi:CMRF35-like molecule 3 isoform X1 [Parus major]|uniref:CMRF35-like molecule 3 isoform X1 n=1 Tax=Parus major TaxID=9157 RepID=UPI0007713134|nr:CMRF35-like molecule 3 isoform X1 [Parus major]
MCRWAWLHPEEFFVKNHRENSTSEARSWKMRIFLVWTLFLVRAMSTGGQAVTGPRQVTVEQGSSLAVSCSYKPRYKFNSKYWCRKNSLQVCFTYIIQTDGSEVTVTQDRLSIRDNHTANSFRVTLSSVTLEDAGQYSCGVKRRLGINRWHSTKVMVSAGKTGLEAKLAMNFPLFPLPPLQCSGYCPDTSVFTLCTFTAEVSGQRLLCRVQDRGCGGLHFALTLFSLTAVSNTTEDSNVSLLTTNPLCPRGCGEPPVLSQLSVIHLLLLLSIKVPIALAVICGVAWVRSWRRSHDQENLQVLEVSSSTRARGCPLIPTISEPQGCPPVPMVPTLLGPNHPSRPPCARRCLAPGTSAPGKPEPLLAASALEREEFGVQRPCVC